ncbi:MAG: NUDIX hydrolase [Firmicutes bacterium]|nr:NUDIX hydrolase [Bacillota bacterium]
MQQFKYCPVCAGELETRMMEDKERLVCTKCGYVLYENSKPCTAVLVEDNGRVMLTRRGIDPFRDWWDLPGGFLENGEEPVEGAKRELMEETGLEIEVLDLLGIEVDTYGDYGIYTLNFHYLSKPIGGTASPKSDVAEIRWFLPDEIPENIAFANCKSAVEKWVKYKKARKN